MDKLRSERRQSQVLWLRFLERLGYQFSKGCHVFPKITLGSKQHVPEGPEGVPT